MGGLIISVMVTVIPGNAQKSTSRIDVQEMMVRYDDCTNGTLKCGRYEFSRKIVMLVDRTLYWLSRPVVGTYTDTMLKMDVKKHCDIPSGPKIIAANHPTTTDPFFVAAMLKYQTFILINDLLFQVPSPGRISAPFRAYSGNRRKRPGSDRCCHRAFEGWPHYHDLPGRRPEPMEGGFQRSRTGVARLAIESGAPVIPVGISGQS